MVRVHADWHRSMSPDHSYHPHHIHMRPHYSACVRKLKTVCDAGGCRVVRVHADYVRTVGEVCGCPIILVRTHPHQPASVRIHFSKIDFSKLASAVISRSSCPPYLYVFDEMSALPRPYDSALN